MDNQSHWKKELLEAYRKDRGIFLKRFAYILAWACVYAVHLLLKKNGYDVTSSIVLGVFIGILVSHIK